MEVYVIEPSVVSGDMPGSGEALKGGTIFPSGYDVRSNVGDVTQHLDRRVTQMNRSRLVGLGIRQPD